MIGRLRNRLNRREVLRGSLLVGGVLLAGIDKGVWLASAEAQGTKPSAVGKMLGVVDFTGEARVPLGEAFGAELDGRQYTDLSRMTSENSVTPTEQFYIRTRASNLLDSNKPWS